MVHGRLVPDVMEHGRCNLAAGIAIDTGRVDEARPGTFAGMRRAREAIAGGNG